MEERKSLDLLVERIEKQCSVIGEFRADVFRRRIGSVEADVRCGRVESLRVGGARCGPSYSHLCLLP